MDVFIVLCVKVKKFDVSSNMNLEKYFFDKVVVDDILFDSIMRILGSVNRDMVYGIDRISILEEEVFYIVIDIVLVFCISGNEEEDGVGGK